MSVCVWFPRRSRSLFIYILNVNFNYCVGAATGNKRFGRMKCHAVDGLVELLSVSRYVLYAVAILQIPQPKRTVVTRRQQVGAGRIDGQTSNRVLVRCHLVHQFARVDVEEANFAVLVGADHER